MNQLKLVVLMTCHNRQDMTVACLEKVYKQDVPCDVYLVDDGSSDGTSDTVRTKYPAVKLLQGNGNLFWGGGMQLAFSEALKVGYDFYIWLNDDTLLYENAFRNLLNTYNYLVERGQPDSIVVGSTQDAVTGQLTYGGLVRLSRWRPLNFTVLEPGEEPRQSETMNGNCVLIPHRVAEKVGSLDPAFTHDRADSDYGFRARKLGCSVWVMSGYVGTCSQNTLSGTWKDINLPFYERWKKAGKIKGGLPPKEFKEFAKRYAGPFWYIYWLSPYLRLIIFAPIGPLKHLSTKG